MPVSFSGDSERLYIIGIDIPAARYRTDSGSGTWRILVLRTDTSFGGGDDSTSWAARGHSPLEIDLRFGCFGFISSGFGTWTQVGPAATDLFLRMPDSSWRSLSRFPSRLRQLALIRNIFSGLIVPVMAPQVVAALNRPLSLRTSDAAWRHVLDFSGENVEDPFYVPEDPTWSFTLLPWQVSVNNFADDPFDETQGIVLEGIDDGSPQASSEVRLSGPGFNFALQRRSIYSLGLGWVGWLQQTLLPAGAGLDLEVSYQGRAQWEQTFTTSTVAGALDGKTLTVDVVDCPTFASAWAGSISTLNRYEPLSQGSVVGTLAEVPLNGGDVTLTISLDGFDLSADAVLSMQFRTTPVTLSDLHTSADPDLIATSAVSDVAITHFAVVARL